MNSTASPPRSQGRPPDGSAVDLRTDLLDAAEALFAEQGFAATPVREVAEAAGANPALVHYYFGTKRGLLFAVLDRVFEPLAAAVAQLRTARPVRIETITRLLFETFAAHPALPRLVVREVMLTGGDLHTHFLKQYAPRLGGALRPVLERERDEGRLAPETEPASLVLVLLGLCVFPFVARSVAEPALGIRYDDAGLRDLRAQVDRVLQRGVLA